MEPENLSPTHARVQGGNDNETTPLIENVEEMDEDLDIDDQTTSPQSVQAPNDDYYLVFSKILYDFLT